MRLWLLVGLCVSRAAFAEPDTFLFGDGGSGSLTVSTPGVVVNSYAALTVDAPAGTTQLVTAATAGFSPGQLVLVLQAKDDFGDAGFPAVVDLTSNRAGTFELARLAAVSAVLTLSAPLTRGFAAGRTQVIRVPEFAALTVTAAGSITAPPFDGYVGGVVVLLADSVINDGLVSATGAGFLGGAVLSQPVGPMGCTGLEEPPPAGSPRGDGPDVLAVTRTGRGGTPGGGGGGACENGGAGGGGHLKAGGRGGDEMFGLGNGGEGGRGLRYTPLTRLVFGGGGGTGWTAVQMAPSGGSAGGGVVWVRARSITGSGSFVADGANGSPPWSYNVGAAGCGAGGTVILQNQGDLRCGLASATGGTSFAGAYGSGGGGAGGLVVMQGSTISCSVSTLAGVAPLNQYGQRNGAMPAVASDPAYGGSVVQILNGLAAPAVPTLVTPANGAVLSTRTPTVSGTAQPNIGVVMFAQGIELTRAAADSLGAYSMTAPSPLSTGFVRLEVAAFDTSGVMSGRAASVVEIVVSGVDAGSPLDAGALPLDAGVSPVDAGAMPMDAGATPIDAGAATVDAGPGQGSPPSFISTASTTATCGIAYRYAADPAPAVSGTGPFHFSLEPLFGVPVPSGATVDDATGAFSWKPTKAQRGFHLLSLRVTGPVGHADQTFTVAVDCADVTPMKVGCSCDSGLGLLWAALIAVLAASKRSS